MTPEEAGQQLLAAYQAVRDLTAALLVSVESEESEKLDVLVEQRAAVLERVDGLLAGEKTALEQLPPVLAAEIDDAAKALQQQDERLRTALIAAAGEVPAQLAQLRGVRSRLGGYGMLQPGGPEIIDRRG